MQLNDRLQICLLALASRYPDHIVDINEAVLGTQPFEAAGWMAQDMIELFQQTTPELLQAMAHLVVDPQKSEIYLTEYCRILPAFLVHCRGRLPARNAPRKELSISGRKS